MDDISNESSTLVRYGPPSSHDNHTYGTRIIVYKNDGKDYDLYIQLGHEDEPKWEYMGEFSKDKPKIEVYYTEPD